MTQPRTALKFAGDPGHWMPLLPAEWVEDELGWLMTKTLEPAQVTMRPPPGYCVRRVLRGGYVDVELYDASDEVTSWGSVGLADGWFVPDGINTVLAHRRRGLARMLMAELEAVALEAGLTRGVLSASEDGRALYLGTGWVERAPLMAAYFRPEG